MTVKLVTNEKIAETSSKGNQEKWRDGDTWYKLDQFGYEALAEAVTSKLLSFSNVESDTPFTFVRYGIELVKVREHERIACTSKNFLNKNSSIVTINTLLSKISGEPLRTRLEKLNSDKKRIAYLVDATAEFTGLKDFDKYLTLLFEIDSLLLNDDRHLNNIAVIERKGKYDYCPIFDNAAGLLSNMQILRADISPDGLMKSLYASPFHMTFNRELRTVRSLYGPVIEFPVFTRKELNEIVYPFLQYYPERDKSIILERVTTCVLQRQKELLKK